MSDANDSRRLETLALHAGYDPEPTTGARAVPIYHTTSYRFRDSSHAADLFALRDMGPIYSRIGNPTVDVLEKRLAAMHGGVGALGAASGHSAEVLTLLTICKAGDEIVSSSALYGGTYNLFKVTLPRLGITTRFVDSTDPADFADAITPATRALYVESIGNPRLDVPDFEGLAAVAKDAGIPFIVDNTTATPALLRPLEHGANIVVESVTKYIGGHGQAIGGVLTDGGTFPWDNGKFPEFTEPNPGYHGLKLYEALGEQAFVLKARLEALRDLGPCMSPQNAHTILTGLETLPLRMERHSTNGLAVAKHLETHPKVGWVSYPGLETHPSFERANRYLPKGAGGLLTFGVKGGLDAGRRFIDTVDLISLVANIGDTRTLVIHPASTTHQQLSTEEREAAGVGDDLVRLSVGIEHIDDIVEDLDRGLAAV